MKNGWTFDKPMASLSIYHLGVLPRMAILLNLAINVTLAQCCNGGLTNFEILFGKNLFCKTCSTKIVIYVDYLFI